MPVGTAGAGAGFVQQPLLPLAARGPASVPVTRQGSGSPSPAQ